MRAEDDSNTYLFSGWNYAVTDVVRNKTYTAIYMAFPKAYTVMFKNWDSVLLFLNANCQYGKPVYEPTVVNPPPSEEPLLYTYVHSGWSPAFNGVCEGNAVYTAQFEKDYIEYPIIFKDYDGTVISSAEYHYGDSVVIPADPVRAANDTFFYTFTGWDREVSDTCVGAVTYVAQYESTYNEYTVTFYDYDGTVLSQKADYHWGDSVSVPANPTRESDGVNNYSFACWSPDVSPTIVGNAEYTAQYAANVAEYTVEFRDWDAYVISSDTYVWSAIVDVPDDPYRVSDDVYAYEFIEWSPAVTAVNGNAVYIAQYSSAYREYIVEFLDEDGTTISRTVYHWGDAVTPPGVPDKPTDEYSVYTFSDWDQPVALTCQGDATYVATYISVPRTYTVSFVDWDGEPWYVRSDYTYGQTIELPANPSRETTDGVQYFFSNWSPAVDVVTGNTTYTATYTTELVDYTVEFLDRDGNVIASTIYHYGDTLVLPTAPSCSGYTFTGWSPTLVSTVVSDATYTAVYTQIPQSQPSGGGGGFSGGGGGGGLVTSTDTPPASDTVYVPTVAETVGGAVTIPEGEYREGDEVTVTVTPDVGYAVRDVIITDAEGNVIEYVLNSDGTYTYVQPAGTVTIEPVFGKKYDDVEDTAWYAESVYYCADEHIMDGTSVTTFSPVSQSTRAQVAQVFYNMEGAPEAPAQSVFEDVDASGAWYGPAVTWAAERGYVEGCGNGVFAPEADITREQLVTVLYRYTTDKGYATETPISDLSMFNDCEEVSGWAEEALCWAVANGIVGGTPEGNVNPTDTASRAEIAAIFQRYHSNIIG